MKELFGMRTSLKYSVLKEQKMDYATGKEVSKIKFRGYDFYVSGAKSEAEHTQVISSFESYLNEHGYSCDTFGDGTWEDCVRINNTKGFLYLSIPVDDMDDKAEIADLYQEWKKK